MDSKDIATTGYHNDESEKIMRVQRDDEQCERDNRVDGQRYKTTWNSMFNESIALENSRAKQSVRTEQNVRTKKLIKMCKLLG